MSATQLSTMVEFYEDARCQWRWRIKSSQNGEIIAVSYEGYENREGCISNLSIVCSTGLNWKIHNGQIVGAGS